MTDVLPFALAAALAAVHVSGWRLGFLDVLPRSAWLSFAGGTSVAYVFVHLLPLMARLQESLAEAGAAEWLVSRYHIWLLALAGLVVFYGLEIVVNSSKEKGGGDASTGVFWVHVGSYALYNVLVGYLLEWGEGRTPTGVLLFALAMALHFVVNDAALRADHRERYQRAGRWILAGAVLVGCALGLVTELGEAAVAALLGVLGGSIVLNALKEELPGEQESRFWPFAVGAAAYSALLLLV